MAKLKPHTITVNGQKTVVHLADIYQNIGAVVGVNKLSDDAQIENAADITDLIKLGQAIKVRVGYGAEGARLKYSYVFCDIDNAKNMGKMIGKGFKNAEVQTVGIRRRRKLT